MNNIKGINLTTDFKWVVSFLFDSKFSTNRTRSFDNFKDAKSFFFSLPARV